MQIRHDLFTAAATLLLGLFILSHAANMPAAGAIPGPGVFPRLIGYGLIGLSFVNIIMSLLGKSLAPPPLSMRETAKALWIIAASGIYFFLLGRVGFVLLTPLYAVALIGGLTEWGSPAHKGRKAFLIAKMIGLSLLLTAIVYFVFTRAFLVSLP